MEAAVLGGYAGPTNVCTSLDPSADDEYVIYNIVTCDESSVVVSTTADEEADRGHLLRQRRLRRRTNVQLRVVDDMPGLWLWHIPTVVLLFCKQSGRRPH